MNIFVLFFAWRQRTQSSARTFFKTGNCHFSITQAGGKGALVLLRRGLQMNQFHVCKGFEASAA